MCIPVHLLLGENSRQSQRHHHCRTGDMAQSSSFKTLSASISKQKSQTPTVSLQNSFEETCQSVAYRVYDDWITGFRSLTMAQLSDAIAKCESYLCGYYDGIMIDFIESLRMPKIPGDLLVRLGTEQQNESEDEEDTVSDVEPVASSVVPSQAPKPAPSDRMAALRRAKDAITQQQHSALPTGPRVLSNNPSSFGKPNPQILPSPGPSFSFLSSQAGPSNSNPTHNPNSYKNCDGEFIDGYDDAFVFGC